MRLIVGMFASVGLFVAAPAVAQAQAAINVGMQVTDAGGAPVGTVTAIKGENLLVKTDKHEALLPKASFSVSNGKLLFGMTQAQLDGQIEQSLTAANAAIAAGATVNGIAGTKVGTIDSVADGKATITLQSGKKIAVPQEGLRGNADGTVTIGYSSEQLEALLQASASPTDASAASPPASDASGN
jgi:preprotein translocase subunit YajC